jgi:RND family efflux transporter MFP subunit
MTTQQTLAIRLSAPLVLVVSLGAFALACGRSPEPKREPVAIAPFAGTVHVVRDTTITATLDAAGVAAPLQQATLSTKLMGTVTAVLVQEGDAVAAGQPLVRLDARDLTAKASQVAASVTEAQVMHRDALTQANRIRALYADSAATRAQLDAVETALARADAGLRTAQAAASELGAVTSYAVIRAPFAGIVTKRFVDPGAFASPGAPLVAVQDPSRLRITANTTPDAARGLRRGQSLAATIEGRPMRAIIEGVVPAMAGNLYAINALVPNPGRIILSGSTATLAIPTGERAALVVPARAVTREGDLTGVTLRTASGDERRWIRLGAASGEVIEVSAGLRVGDRVVVPTGRVAVAPPSTPGEN